MTFGGLNQLCFDHVVHPWRIFFINFFNRYSFLDNLSLMDHLVDKEFGKWMSKSILPPLLIYTRHAYVFQNLGWTKWLPGFWFFSIAMVADYSFYVKSIATWAPTFFGHIISVLHLHTQQLALKNKQNSGVYFTCPKLSKRK